ELTDGDLNTYIELHENNPVVLELGSDITFDRIMLQENIWNGQRIARILLEYWDDQKWRSIEETSTVGYKRLLRTDEITTSRLRLTVIESKGPSQLAEFGLYKASSGEEE
ncbi:MAG: alpha-L-fucosidase, partial [Cyclobacteriaceae bacterium]